MTETRLENLIEPHGGRLVNAVAAAPEAEQLNAAWRHFPKLRLDERHAADLELLAIGAYSPLAGFMGQADYLRVVHEARLADGLPWGLPITLPVERDAVRTLAHSGKVALAGADGRALGLLEVEEVYEREPDEAALVFGTRDLAHPGVAGLSREATYLAAGQVQLFARPAQAFRTHCLDPKDTRKWFAEHGWMRIAGFQTRNPIHRAHEYLLRCAMELVDGLLIHPLMGQTKADDVPHQVRWLSYQALLGHYLPRQRILLSVFPAAMRYAGPREALFHAMVRKNYGCSHFIVGRDHAGVGAYYGPLDAHKIFSRYTKAELGIDLLLFEHAFYCRKCDAMATVRTCPHDESLHERLSGTKVRELFRSGQMPPATLSRPEVAGVLAQAWISAASLDTPGD